MFISAAKRMEHGRMIKYNIIYILINLFISIPLNFITSYYEHNTCLPNNIIFEPILTILYVKFIRISGTKLTSNKDSQREITNNMHISLSTAAPHL
jgi:hypothetical protein